MTLYNKRMFIWSGFMVLFHVSQWMTIGCGPIWYVLGVAWFVSFGMFIYNMIKHIEYVKEQK